MGKPGFGEQAPRGYIVIVVDKDAPGEHAQRSFYNAHVIVQDEMVNIRAVQQCADGRHQNYIVSPHQFAQCSHLPVAGTPYMARSLLLPRRAAVSMVAPNSSGDRAVAVIVPFESHSTPSIDQLVALVASDMARVNATILSRTGSEVTMIPEVANHLISSGGKRLRPMLTLAMANLTGNTGEGHIKLAASVEFMHTATLLHDDVVDESELRRGKLSARMLWGNEASVLVGDFLLGQAFRMMVEVGSLPVLKILSNAAAVIAEGEVMQLAAANNTTTTEDEYLAIINAKTAALFSAAAEVGAAISNRPAAEQTALKSYGRNLGLAFQLVDDALDYAGDSANLGKAIGDDFREGKITLPIILSFRRGSEEERAFWTRTIAEGDIQDGDLERAVALMKQHKALEATMERARSYGAIAHDALAIFPDRPEKAAMLDVIGFCVHRSH